MKVALSTIGKFHTFDLARELQKRGCFSEIFTGYPAFKLRNEGLPPSKIKSFPWLHAPYMAFRHKDKLPRSLVWAWEYWDRVLFDRHIARHVGDCDVFVGLSSSALLTGEKVKAAGALYVCDRGSTHIREQDRILREEHDAWGLPFDGIDIRIIDREEREYASADIITVPSQFNVESFIKQGVIPGKLKKVPYGVDLSRFEKVSSPSPDDFQVLFVGGVSLRKGVPYLLEAFARVTHAEKRLLIVGSYEAWFIKWIKRSGFSLEKVEFLGAVPQGELKKIMSESHVMVLPSIEEGLAMVQAQALACGCPVIATENTGALDLFDDGREGFIVKPRSADMLAEKIQYLADHPADRAEMGCAALMKVRSFGGWAQYGDSYFAMLEAAYAHRSV
jgi:glycosyltransferase involved in cell wall biosynthesis